MTTQDTQTLRERAIAAYQAKQAPTPAPKQTAAERPAAAIVDVIAEFGIVPQGF